MRSHTLTNYGSPYPVSCWIGSFHECSWRPNVEETDGRVLNLQLCPTGCWLCRGSSAGKKTSRFSLCTAGFHCSFSHKFLKIHTDSSKFLPANRVIIATIQSLYL